MIKILTGKQQEILDEMLRSIGNKENYFLPAKDRQIGKTYVLNELAFTLQALGLTVFILTPYKNQEYFGERFISLDPMDFSGRLKEDVVIIADEVRFEMMRKFVGYCKYRKVPIVGYVNFEKLIKIDPIQFKREYSCTWS